MKEFKGTPGKWEVDPHCRTLVRGIEYANISECHAANNFCDHIAYAKDGTHWEENEEVAEANAQLIAAAPELLQSLLKLTEMLSSPLVTNEERFIAELDQEVRKAKEIINKALGK